MPQKNWVLWSVGLTSLTSNAQIVCRLQYRPLGSKIFLFILHGSKKIVKNFQTKIQSGTWSKYVLKNTKKSKKSKILSSPLSKCHKSIVNNSYHFLITIVPCNAISQNFGFFWILVFFKLYFGHVADSFLAWKIITIFSDSCRINKKILEPFRRNWRWQTTGKTNNPLNSLFLRHPVVTVDAPPTQVLRFGEAIKIVFF